MKLVKNYLDSLETYLPEEMKQDVREELEASIYGEIEDKQEQLGRELEINEQEDILQNLGHPMMVASSYLPNQQLISKAYFPAFKRSLEITLFIVLAINLLFALPDLFSEGNLIGKTFRLFWHLANAALWAIAVVVVSFYFIEKSKVKIGDIYAWSAKDISAIKPKLSINRVEVFFEMIMEIVFLSWWNGLLKWPAIFEENGVKTIVRMSEQWQSVHWIVNIILGLSIVLSLYKILIAGWNKPALMGNIILNLASLVVIYKMFQFDPYVIFSDSITSHSKWQNFLQYFDFGIQSILAIVTIFIVWETYTNVFKLKKNK